MKIGSYLSGDTRRLFAARGDTAIDLGAASPDAAFKSVDAFISSGQDALIQARALVDAPPPAETVAQKMLPAELGAILDQLTPREARILRLRYGLQDGESRTLKEVGEMFGLSRERIRQLEKEALRKLRHPNFAGHLRQYLN